LGVGQLVGLGLGAALVPRERSTTAVLADIDDLGINQHVSSDEPKRPIETLFEERIGGRPPFIHRAIEHMLWETGPEVVANRPPVLLKECSKLRVLEPEKAKVTVVFGVVL
jgi:hypothetical protein